MKVIAPKTPCRYPKPTPKYCDSSVRILSVGGGFGTPVFLPRSLTSHGSVAIAERNLDTSLRMASVGSTGSARCSALRTCAIPSPQHVLQQVVACTGGIESSENFAEDTASPYHGELIVFSLLRIACFRSPMSPAIARLRLPVSWLLSTNSAKARMLPRSGFVQRFNVDAWRSARL